MIASFLSYRSIGLWIKIVKISLEDYTLPHARKMVSYESIFQQVTEAQWFRSTDQNFDELDYS